MSDADLIAKHIAEKGVTKCPPAAAAPTEAVIPREATRALRQHHDAAAERYAAEVHDRASPKGRAQRRAEDLANPKPLPVAAPEPKAGWDSRPAPETRVAKPDIRAARLAAEAESAKKVRNSNETATESSPPEPLSDPGPPPQMAWVSVRELWVDPRYQREMKASRASRGLVHRIAAGWKWALFQPLTVALGSPADDGSRGRYAVIDGQHRLEAAKRRKIEQLPCYVIDAATVEEQAGYFVGLNRERKALLPTQLHRAAAVAGDANALRVDAVCRAAGVAIVTGGGKAGLGPDRTVAVVKIRQLIERYGEEVVIEGLRLLVEGAGEKRDQLKAEMIAGVVKLMAVTSWRRGMDREKLIRILRVNSTANWLFKAREHKREHGGNTGEAVAALIVAAYGVAR